jgi:hypothetical protein
MTENIKTCENCYSSTEPCIEEDCLGALVREAFKSMKIDLNEMEIDDEY